MPIKHPCSYERHVGDELVQRPVDANDNLDAMSLASRLVAAQARIHQLEQQVENSAVLRKRSLMAVGAIHDINNVLAAIGGITELIARDAPTNIQEDLARVLQSVQDGTYLLRQVLSGNVSVPLLRIIDISLLLADVLHLLKYCVQENLSVITHIEMTASVIGHAHDVRAVFVNLIMNAIAAMPEGGTLTVETVVHEQHVAIMITDTGVGIAGDRQASIFTPLHSDARGSGVGLSISRSTIEEYGGTLTVQSAIGCGSCFTVVLPRLHEPL